jgi:DNA processing protein
LFHYPTNQNLYFLKGFLMAHHHLPYWLAALHLPGIGPRTMLRWLEHFADIKALFHASRDEMEAKGISAKCIQVLQQMNWQLIEEDLKWVQAENHHIITLEEESYPHLLKQISDPPLVLFIRGNKSILLNTQIAMVGSRKPTMLGVKNAKQFAYALAEAGLTVTSGLALGIDGASHQGALTAKGYTIGVCGTGLKHIYPTSHRSLAEKMIREGALVSEFPLNTAPYAANFPRRNRIIGGLSIGVLVVEAALKSGSLITARHALEQGREVFAIPGTIENPLARGCHHLIRQGAKLVETVNDILEELSGRYVACSSLTPSSNKSLDNALSPSHRALLEQIDYEITPVDVILLRSRLTAGEVSSILLILELNGYIQSVPGGYIRAILNH